jgi:PAS domain S-box-containing protein
MLIWLPQGGKSSVSRWQAARYQITHLVSGLPNASFLVLEHEAAPVIRTFQEERAGLLFFVADLFVVGLLLSWGASRMIVGPLTRLQEATQTLGARIAAGKRVDLPASPIAEYQALSRAFEDMAGRLAHSFQQVIAARTGLEQEVRERTAELAQFKSTLDQTRDCVFMFDAVEFRFFYVNEGAVHHIGYGRRTLLGMRAYSINPNLSKIGFSELVAPLINGERPWLLFETFHRHRQGHLIPVEMFLQYVPPEPSAGGAGAQATSEPGRFVAIVRDLSERRRAERIQSEFISTVSHELRTPVSALVGALKLLQSGALKENEAKSAELLALAGRNGERLHALVNDLLDLEKLASGKMRFDFKVHGLQELVSEAVESARGLGHDRGVELAVAGELPPVQVLVDSGRFDQVLNNLLSNAIKFSPQDARVAVRAALIGRTVRIQVEDHGPGIPEGFQDRVFEKFAQADSSNHRQAGGTGLGLAISRDIIERMGGSIDFETEEGEGTTFFFDLPIWSLEREEDASLPDPAAGWVPGNSGPVLLVSEDSGTAGRITEALNAAGHETVWVRAAVDALGELLHNPDFGLMIFDLAVGDIGWPALIATLRSRYGERLFPVIPFLSDPSRRDALMLDDRDRVLWLAKPLDLSDLAIITERTRALAAHRTPRLLRIADEGTDPRDVVRTLAARTEMQLAGSIASAQAKLQTTRFDVVLLDLSLRDGSGLELLTHLRAAVPAAGLFVVVAESDEASARTRIRQELLCDGRSVEDLVALVAERLSMGETSEEGLPS